MAMLKGDDNAILDYIKCSLKNKQRTKIRKGSSKSEMTPINVTQKDIEDFKKYKLPFLKKVCY